MEIISYIVVPIYILYFLKILAYFNRFSLLSYAQINSYLDVCNFFLKLLVGMLLIYYYYVHSKHHKSVMLTAGVLLVSMTLESAVVDYHSMLKYI